MSNVFLQHTVEMRIRLSPYYINKIQEGVQDKLNRQLLRYSEVFKGVLLSYSNIKILQEKAEIKDVTPIIYFKIQFKL